ncbi:synaptosomal-associated protein 29-like isoform X1 [Saccoglossus kowalevskii]|uniref:Synaptosomal-associated protein 29-like n=1 Tax=Saccoglossus kowalevskii TaxID=10224 RepID=A0ABM0GPJ7_SACKO|nr:PREDICTED: synaptosomal-associated protein 29-like [Saccoglossus kowalevskii]
MAGRAAISFPDDDGYEGDSGYGKANRNNEQYDFLQQYETRNRDMLQSTQRSLGVMYETERIGIDTAEELLHQGEQLNNTEKNLDKINQDMKVAQTHLTSLKSVFGGFVNLFKSKPKEEEAEVKERKTNDYLDSAINQKPTREDDIHPAMRLRDPYSSNYYEQYNAGSAGSSGSGSQSKMRQMDTQINKNIDEMSSGMSRLKGLALGLGQEIETQNDQIDRLTTKADKADQTIFGANKQMNKILFK